MSSPVARRLEFTVPGPPRGKGRPRFARIGSFTKSYTDAKTAAYENLIALAASQAHQGKPRLDGPLRVWILFVLQRPKSAPKRVTYPATKPDLDNMAKAVFDGCNQAGVWADDSRVVDVHARKIYGEPRCDVRIETVPEVAGDPIAPPLGLFADFKESPMDALR